MSEGRARHGAVASTRGTLHQLWVAVEKCYEMHRTGQKILIETQGDVSGEDQTEVKQYSDDLTDNHLCFWKTLKNWMHDSFDPTKYKSLILLTTQQFGPTATITSWNHESQDRRLEIVQAIYDRNEKAYSQAQSKKKQATVPKSLQLQRYIFVDERKDKLADALDRFFIEAEAPETPAFYEQLKGQYLKGVLEGKKDDFLCALFGYISQPTNDNLCCWEISYESFSQKVEELTGIYCRDTKVFPAVSVQPISDADLSDHKRNRLFAQKILDIGYGEVLRTAIEHYHTALKTVNDEFKAYAVPQRRTEQYSKELVEQFRVKHRQAIRNSTDVIKDSKNLYDDTTSSTPLPFSGFDSTPLAFRNGLLHAEMDDDDKDLKWRTESDE